MEGKSILFTGFWSLLFLLTAYCLPATGKVIYVDDDGPADFNNIQAAIDDANNGDAILVADGTYTGNGNRDIDFKGKAITVKSENGAETCIIDCQGSEKDLHRGFHLHTNERNDSVIDGFTIKNGCAYDGGGLKCSNSSPIVKNCVIRDNIAAIAHGDPFSFLTAGGGIYSYAGTLKILNCYFYGNIATGYGGAIYSSSSSSSLINCKLSNNRASKGGAILLYKDEMQIKNCVFSSNYTTAIDAGMGGGIYCNRSNSEINNCSLINNVGNNKGGGIYLSNSNVTINNTIIFDNSAPKGPEIGLQYGGFEPSSLIISHSDVKGGIIEIYIDDQSVIDWKEGNIDIDPLFINPGYWNLNDTPDDPNDDFWVDGDYHLKSKAGRFDPNTQSWVIDDVHSLCIDAGDPNSPVGYEPNSVYINMGAYGGTLEASMSLISDVNYFQQSYSPNPANGAADILLEPTLSWLSDKIAVTHEVYFGTSNLPPFVQKCYQTNFNFGALEPNTQYYWRIDDVNSLLNRVIGNIWTFTTRDSVQAYHPYPADGATSVKTDVTLSWGAGLDAIAHDVYFGTDFNDVNEATIANPLGVLVSLGTISNSYKPSTLKYYKKYYWRVDEIDSNGITTTGNIWAFTTQQGAGKGAMCFIGSTPVWIGDKTVAISTAGIGQNTGGNDTIEQVQEHEGTFTVYDVLLDSGNCITVAENHYFMTEAGEWYSLHDLKAGMRLKTSKGSVGITSITKQPDPYIGKVYNLKIQGSDRYMVGEDAVIVRDY